MVKVPSPACARIVSAISRIARSTSGERGTNSMSGIQKFHITSPRDRTVATQRLEVNFQSNNPNTMYLGSPGAVGKFGASE